MSRTLELPQSSVLFIPVGVLTNLIALYLVSGSEHVSFFLLLSAVVASGFLADLITALAHFGFDYVIPGGMPIFGPIAKEFRKHHEAPGLSPSNYAMNFTKGAYGSFPIAVLVICLAWNGSESALSFFLLATLMGISIWALFFHQIHSYAHMGSLLPAAEFNKWTDRIQHLSTEREQIKEFERLFQTVPIPRVIRVLQKYRIFLNPSIHNLHHISFEKNFSSVNGWSDPVTNLLLSPISRYLKKREYTDHSPA